MKELLVNVFLAVVGVLSLAFIAFVVLPYNETAIEKTQDNPKTYFEVEEELEEVFLTTDLYVYDDECDGNCCIYYVQELDTGIRYRVLYKLVWAGFPFQYTWKFNHYVCDGKKGLDEI